MAFAIALDGTCWDDGGRPGGYSAANGDRFIGKVDKRIAWRRRPPTSWEEAKAADHVYAALRDYVEAIALADAERAGEAAHRFARRHELLCGQVLRSAVAEWRRGGWK